MSPKFGVGLVVGKFAPLHLGHQFVIDTARERCQRVVVLSYSKPEFAGCEPERRLQWLSALYPEVEVHVLSDAQLSKHGLHLPNNSAPAEEHRRFVALVCHRLLALQIEAVFTSEDYGEPFAASLTDYYRRYLGERARVVHVAVDPSRTRFPTSGTALRTCALELGRWVHPIVRASLTPRVVFLGAESSGKTTLTRAVASALGTQHVEEYGRELWVERAGNLDEASLLEIGREQVRREEAALPSCEGALCCDTSPLTTYIYSLLWYGRADAELAQLAKRSYALTVLCEPDFEFVQDGTRATREFQRQQHELTLRELAQRGISYLVARGGVEERARRVSKAVKGLGSALSPYRHDAP